MVETAGGVPLPARSRCWRPGREPLAPYYLYRVASMLVRHLPRRLCWWLADRVADVLLVVVPRSFDGLADNLRHVLPGVSQREMARVLRSNVRDLTRGWVELMALPDDPNGAMSRLRAIDLPNYTRALARGRGVVVASLHFGAWEVGLAAWNGGGRDLALLAELLRPRKLFDIIAGARGALGVQVIPIDIDGMRSCDAGAARRIGAAAMREVIRCLRQGRAVAIALDRDLTGTGKLIPFFGEPAPIPMGVVDVAIRTGAAVVPIVLARNRNEVLGLVFPEVTYDPEQPRAAEVERVTGELLRLFERVIRAQPEQWHVLDRIWPEAAA